MSLYFCWIVSYICVLNHLISADENFDISLLGWYKSRTQRLCDWMWIKASYLVFLLSSTSLSLLVTTEGLLRSFLLFVCCVIQDGLHAYFFFHLYQVPQNAKKHGSLSFLLSLYLYSKLRNNSILTLSWMPIPENLHHWLIHNTSSF